MYNRGGHRAEQVDLHMMAFGINRDGRGCTEKLS